MGGELAGIRLSKAVFPPAAFLFFAGFRAGNFGDRGGLLVTAFSGTFRASSTIPNGRRAVAAIPALTDKRSDTVRSNASLLWHTCAPSGVAVGTLAAAATLSLAIAAWVCSLDI